jgi:hypothetical protein
MDKLKKILAMRAVWLGVGSVVGAFWGPDASDAVNTVGTIISTVLM